MKVNQMKAFGIWILHLIQFNKFPVHKFIKVSMYDFRLNKREREREGRSLFEMCPRCKLKNGTEI